jgi:nitrite reductase/ring-hydroxylating ferredoxin subunit
MKAVRILFILATILFTACDDESQYSIYRVNFVFDKSIHPYNQINTYGQFICIKRGASAGQYNVTDATGYTQTVNIPEQQMQMNPYHYGLGGLIIGIPMNCDGYIWAYDWACPSCDNQRHRIELDYVMGHAKCPNCAAVFDLNSGGIAIEGKSRPLWHYRVYTNDQNVIIQN